MSDPNTDITIPTATVDRICETMVANNVAQLEFADKCFGRLETIVVQALEVGVAGVGQLIQAKMADDALEERRLGLEEQRLQAELAQAALNALDYNDKSPMKKALVCHVAALSGAEIPPEDKSEDAA